MCVYTYIYILYITIRFWNRKKLIEQFQLIWWYSHRWIFSGSCVIGQVFCKVDCSAKLQGFILAVDHIVVDTQLLGAILRKTYQYFARSAFRFSEIMCFKVWINTPLFTGQCFIIWITNFIVTIAEYSTYMIH